MNGEDQNPGLKRPALWFLCKRLGRHSYRNEAPGTDGAVFRTCARCGSSPRRDCEFGVPLTGWYDCTSALAWWMR